METPVVVRSVIDAGDRKAALFQFEVPADRFAPGSTPARSTSSTRSLGTLRSHASTCLSDSDRLLPTTSRLANCWPLPRRRAAHVAFIRREISARCAAVNFRLRRRVTFDARIIARPVSAARADFNAVNWDSSSEIFLSRREVMSAINPALYHNVLLEYVRVRSKFTHLDLRSVMTARFDRRGTYDQTAGHCSARIETARGGAS